MRTRTIAFIVPMGTGHPTKDCSSLFPAILNMEVAVAVTSKSFVYIYQIAQPTTL